MLNSSNKTKIILLFGLFLVFGFFPQISQSSPLPVNYISGSIGTFDQTPACDDNPNNDPTSQQGSGTIRYLIANPSMCDRVIVTVPWKWSGEKARLVEINPLVPWESISYDSCNVAVSGGGGFISSSGEQPRQRHIERGCLVDEICDEWTGCYCPPGLEGDYCLDCTGEGSQHCSEMFANETGTFTATIRGGASPININISFDTNDDAYGSAVTCGLNGSITAECIPKTCTTDNDCPAISPPEKACEGNKAVTYGRYKCVGGTCSTTQKAKTSEINCGPPITENFCSGGDVWLRESGGCDSVTKNCFPVEERFVQDCPAKTCGPVYEEKTCVGDGAVRTQRKKDCTGGCSLGQCLPASYTELVGSATTQNCPSCGSWQEMPNSRSCQGDGLVAEMFRVCYKCETVGGTTDCIEDPEYEIQEVGPNCSPGELICKDGDVKITGGCIDKGGGSAYCRDKEDLVDGCDPEQIYCQGDGGPDTNVMARGGCSTTGGAHCRRQEERKIDCGLTQEGAIKYKYCAGPEVIDVNELIDYGFPLEALGITINRVMAVRNLTEKGCTDTGNNPRCYENPDLKTEPRQEDVCLQEDYCDPAKTENKKVCGNPDIQDSGDQLWNKKAEYCYANYCNQTKDAAGNPLDAWCVEDERLEPFPLITYTDKIADCPVFNCDEEAQKDEFWQGEDVIQGNLQCCSWSTNAVCARLQKWCKDKTGCGIKAGQQDAECLEADAARLILGPEVLVNDCPVVNCDDEWDKPGHGVWEKVSTYCQDNQVWAKYKCQEKGCNPISQAPGKDMCGDKDEPVTKEEVVESCIKPFRWAGEDAGCGGAPIAVIRQDQTCVAGYVFGAEGPRDHIKCSVCIEAAGVAKCDWLDRGIFVTEPCKPCTGWTQRCEGNQFVQSRICYRCSADGQGDCEEYIDQPPSLPCCPAGICPTAGGSGAQTITTINEETGEEEQIIVDVGQNTLGNTADQCIGNNVGNYPIKVDCNCLPPGPSNLWGATCECEISSQIDLNSPNITEQCQYGCTNGACDPASTCTATYVSAGKKVHNVCQDGKCQAVPNVPGQNNSDQCSRLDALACLDSISGHYECVLDQNNQPGCQWIDQPGNHQCQGPADCVVYQGCLDSDNNGVNDSCGPKFGLDADECSSNDDCVHYECQPSSGGLACQAVAGAGASNCFPNDSASCRYEHLCSAGSCVIAQDCFNDVCRPRAFSGRNDCAVDTDCTTRYGCQQNADTDAWECVRKEGQLVDECAPGGEECTSHLECSSGSCVQTPGRGADQCQNQNDCQRLECTRTGVGGKCEPRPGTGSDLCASDSDCQFSHTVCQGQMCLTQLGPGLSQCNPLLADQCPRTNVCQQQSNGTYQCINVPASQAGGRRTCNTWQDCADTHNECAIDSDGRAQCVNKPGPGDDLCRNREDCIHTECVSDSCVERQNPGENQCESGRDNSCTFHNECQNSICVIVLSSGISECGSVNSSCVDPDASYQTCDGTACVTRQGSAPPGTRTCQTANDCDSHTICQGSPAVCAEVVGAGADGCTLGQNNTCLGHNECRNNTCQWIAGVAGLNQCQTLADCQQHYKCEIQRGNASCVLDPTPGANECNPSDPNSCYRNECEIIDQDTAKCIQKPGAGPDQCQGDEECYRMDCVHPGCLLSMQCKKVAGLGDDICLSNNDCFHKECVDTTGDGVADSCQNQPGPGEDKCANDNECREHSICFSTDADPAFEECRLVQEPGISECGSLADCGNSRLGCVDNNGLMTCDFVPESSTAPSCNVPQDCSDDPHYECRDNTCTQIPGPGADSCDPADPNSCIRNECNTDCQCVIGVAGSGQDQCQNNDDCLQAGVHNVCQGERCVAIAGCGPNTCDSDQNCQGLRSECIGLFCLPRTCPGGASNPDCRDRCQDNQNCPRHSECVPSGSILPGVGFVPPNPSFPYVCWDAPGPGPDFCQNNTDCRGGPGGPPPSCANPPCVSTCGFEIEHCINPAMYCFDDPTTPWNDCSVPCSQPGAVPLPLALFAPLCSLISESVGSVGVPCETDINCWVIPPPPEPPRPGEPPPPDEPPYDFATICGSDGKCYAFPGLPGPYECSSSADCGALSHFVCAFELDSLGGSQCKEIPGPGSNNCSNDADCFSIPPPTDFSALCASDGSCVAVPGDPGIRQCSSSADCGTPYIDNMAVSEGNYCTGTAGEGVISFQWTYENEGGFNESEFDFQVDNNSDFSSPEVNRTYVNLNTPPGATNGQIVLVRPQSPEPSDDYLAYNTAYYWRAKVYSANGYDSGWREGASFRTAVHAYPNPRFSFQPPNPLVSQSIAFTDRSTCYDNNNSAYPCKDGSVAYLWNFGDNSTSSTKGNVDHSYSQAQVYVVVFMITDDIGFCIVERGISVSEEPGLIPEWKEISPF